MENEIDYKQLFIDTGNFIVAIRDAKNWDEHNPLTPESILNEVLSYMSNRELFAQ